MTREQAQAKLKDRMLSTEEHERIHQYLYYLDAENITPKPTSAKRPAKNSRHTRPKAPL